MERDTEWDREKTDKEAGVGGREKGEERERERQAQNRHRKGRNRDTERMERVREGRRDREGCRQSQTER